MGISQADADGLSVRMSPCELYGTVVTNGAQARLSCWAGCAGDSREKYHFMGWCTWVRVGDDLSVVKEKIYGAECLFSLLCYADSKGKVLQQEVS